MPMTSSFFYLRFTGIFSFVFLAISLCDYVLAGPEKPKTFVYKTVDDVSIEADVYLPKGEAPRPVLLWFHGGALMLGNRNNVPPQLIKLCREENFILVSADYRLAPETLLPGVVSDARDVVKWIHEKGPELFKANPKKLVVSGASAGGYLAQMTGISDIPLPTAILSYWGYGDILGDWCTKPNTKFGGGASAPSKEEAFANVGTRPITGITKEENSKRSKLFFYMKNNGLWTEIVTGLKPSNSVDRLTPFCPLRNVSKDYPPILLIHGTADRDVPVEQSLAMNEALIKAGGQVELVTVEGGGHSLWGGDKEKIEAAFQRSFEFIRTHLNTK